MIGSTNRVEWKNNDQIALIGHEFYRRLFRLSPSLQELKAFARPKVDFLCAQADFGFAISPRKSKTYEALPGLKVLSILWSLTRRDPQIARIAELIEKASLSKEKGLESLRRAAPLSHGAWEIRTPLSPQQYLKALKEEEQRELARVGRWGWQMVQGPNDFKLYPPRGTGRRQISDSLQVSGEIRTSANGGSIVEVTMTGGIEILRRHAAEMLTSCARPDIDLVYKDLVGQS